MTKVVKGAGEKVGAKGREPAQVGWRSRVVGFVEKPANQFTANALNFRRHPNAQRDAFRGVLKEIGFAGAVLENVRTGNLLDGHLRVEEALSVDDLTPIPCVQVDLSEEEERLLLATYDPLSAMAVHDAETLELLLRDVSAEDESVSLMLETLRVEAEMFTENGGGVMEGERLTRKKSPDVKVVVAVPDLRTVEAALRETGFENRGAALVEVCNFYLSEKGQPNI